MKKNILIALLGLFVLYDICRSFDQHLHMPLDGDLALIVLPADCFKAAMKDPLGIQASVNGKVYHASNRAFAHWTMSLYFKTVPFFFQLFSSPLDSIYLAAALAKIIFQLLIAFMLARYARPSTFQLTDLIISFAILMPLFQTGGFNSYIGVIDQSITYSFFYALPIALLLVFFFPFYRYFKSDEPLNFSPIKHAVWLLFIVFLSFNGPLTCAIVVTLVASIFIFLFFYKVAGIKQIQLDKTVRNYLIGFFLLALYSLYVGTFNAEKFSTPLPIYARYEQLLDGLQKMFIGNEALPILVVFIAATILILKKKSGSSNIEWLVIPIVFYCVFFIVLLPLGGYRIYRPNVLRNDTAIPILICCFFLMIYTTRIILELTFKFKAIYMIVLVGLLLFFHLSDGHISSRNQSEKKAILEIAASKKQTVVINDYCTILSYKPITDSLESDIHMKLLHYYGVIDKPKLYYQKY